MKKQKGLLAVALITVMAVAALALSACGGSSSASTQAASSSSEALSVTSEPTEEKSEPAVALPDEPFYVMIVGSDSREGTVHKYGQYADGLGRSDTLMLARIDPKDYLITLVTVPRDTQAEFEGQRCKINETFHWGGIDSLKQAVTDLTGVNPDHYIITTFVGFEDLVDAMGGVTVNVPIDESMEDIVSGEMVEFPAGEGTLNGREALVFARERHAYENLYDGNLQEAYRQTNDRYILRSIIEQVMATSDPGALAEKMLANMETDWDKEQLVALVEDFAKNADKVHFQSGTGPYQGDIDPSIELWLAYRDEDTWARVIDVVNEGGDPQTVVPIVSAS